MQQKSKIYKPSCRKRAQQRARGPSSMLHSWASPVALCLCPPLVVPGWDELLRKATALAEVARKSSNEDCFRVRLARTWGLRMRKSQVVSEMAAGKEKKGRSGKLAARIITIKELLGNLYLLSLNRSPPLHDFAAFLWSHVTPYSPHDRSGAASRVPPRSFGPNQLALLSLA
jgi:hypothetical protein